MLHRKSPAAAGMKDRRETEMTVRMSTLTNNPVTLQPMTPTAKTVYRAGFYSPAGNLLKHQEAWPAADNPTPQMIADISATSHIEVYGSGTVLVWEDVDMEPAPHISCCVEAEARRDFGPAVAPVPQYIFDVNHLAGTIMAYLADED
jgi:hypothetical protein